MNIFGNGFMTIAEVDLYQAYEDAEDFKRNSQKNIASSYGKRKSREFKESDEEENRVGNKDVSLLADVEEENTSDNTNKTNHSSSNNLSKDLP